MVERESLLCCEIVSVSHGVSWESGTTLASFSLPCFSSAECSGRFGGPLAVLSVFPEGEGGRRDGGIRSSFSRTLSTVGCREELQ